MEVSFLALLCFVFLVAFLSGVFAVIVEMRDDAGAGSLFFFVLLFIPLGSLFLTEFMRKEQLSEIKGRAIEVGQAHYQHSANVEVGEFVWTGNHLGYIVEKK